MYNKYLQSNHWKKTRNKRLRMDNICTICSESARLNIHHLKYKNNKGSILGKEKAYHLRPLCSKCHKTWHYFHGLEIHGNKIYTLAKKLFNLGLSREDAIKLCVNRGFVLRCFQLHKYQQKYPEIKRKVDFFRQRWSIKSRLNVLVGQQ